MNTSKRNSGIELLRIFCILGILCMHLSGIFIKSNNTLTLIQLNIINSLFNTCVTCFILISGYFGITRNFRKIFSLWCIVIFYSLCSALFSILTSGLDLVFIFKSLFPTITGKYWYYTTYIVLVLFAPYINQIPIKLSKKGFQSLLLLLIAIFYIFPTFFYFEILKDNGKGPVNMLIVYLIGRYICLHKSLINRSKSILCFIISSFFAFLLNLATSIIRGCSFAPFARDNSIFMLTGAVSLFLIFNGIVFSSNFINKCCKNIFAVYISESILRNIINTCFPLTFLDGKPYMLVTLLSLSILCFIVLTFIEYLRKVIFYYPENFIYTFITKCYVFSQAKLQKKFSDNKRS